MRCCRETEGLMEARKSTRNRIIKHLPWLNDWSMWWSLAALVEYGKCMRHAMASPHAGQYVTTTSITMTMPMPIIPQIKSTSMELNASCQAGTSNPPTPHHITSHDTASENCNTESNSSIHVRPCSSVILQLKINHLSCFWSKKKDKTTHMYPVVVRHLCCSCIRINRTRVWVGENTKTTISHRWWMGMLWW